MSLDVCGKENLFRVSIQIVSAKHVKVETRRNSGQNKQRKNEKKRRRKKNNDTTVCQTICIIRCIEMLPCRIYLLQFISQNVRQNKLDAINYNRNKNSPIENRYGVSHCGNPVNTMPISLAYSLLSHGFDSDRTSFLFHSVSLSSFRWVYIWCFLWK